jgi:hypothetical protein
MAPWSRQWAITISQNAFRGINSREEKSGLSGSLSNDPTSTKIPRLVLINKKSVVLSRFVVLVLNLPTLSGDERACFYNLFTYVVTNPKLLYSYFSFEQHNVCVFKIFVQTFFIRVRSIGNRSRWDPST